MRLHVERLGAGQGPTVVCVHGVTAHARRFAPLARGPLGDRFRLIAPDLRGHGHSGWEPPWSLEQHVEDLLETVPPDAQLWVGHSLGGRIVLELAHAQPARVARAVLLDPALWVPPPHALQRAEALRREVTFTSVADAVERWIAGGRDAGARADLLAQDFADHLEPTAEGRLRFRYSRSAAIAAFGELARTPTLGPLTVPVCVARCAGSPVCPPELVAALRESAGVLLTTAELPGGHTPMWEAPAETAALVASFLAQP